MSAPWPESSISSTGLSSSAQADCQAREAAVLTTECIVAQEAAKCQDGGGNPADVARAAEYLERARQDLATAIVKRDLIEARMSRMMGKTPSGPRPKLLTTTDPKVAVPPDLSATGRDLDLTGEEGLSDPGRMAREANALHQSYRTACRLEDAATQRLDAMKAFYEQGRVSIDRYLDAVDRRATASIQKADYLARYRSAIALVEEKTVTILDGGPIFVTSVSPKTTESGEARARLVEKFFHDRLIGPAAFASDEPQPEAKAAASAVKAPACCEDCDDECDEDDDDRDLEAENPLGALGLRVMNPKGACQFDSELAIHAMKDEPVTLKVPIAGGGMMEITVRVMKAPVGSPNGKK